MKKYIPGKRITSLDELAEQEFVFFHEKVYHVGWFASWPLRNCKNLIDKGVLLTAKRKRKEGYYPEYIGKEVFKLCSWYQEILKLEKMLTKAGIPHTKRRNFDGWQILYPSSSDFPKDNSQVVCSVIEHFGSYGQEQDLLEIMCLCDEADDSVMGHLTAQEVFERIKQHWSQSHDICET